MLGDLSSARTNTTETCRVCLEAGGDFCQPCSCAGTMGHAHPSCIQRWILEKRGMTCEVCKGSYRGDFQPPPSVPTLPVRQSPPPLSHVQHVVPRSVFVSMDPELELFAWQPGMAAIPQADQGEAHPIWCLAAVLVFMALLLIRGLFETPVAVAAPPGGGPGMNATGSVAVSWNFSAGSFLVAAPALAPGGLEAGVREASNVRLVGMLAGIAVLLALAILALHATPQRGGLTGGGRSVEMLEGCVVDARAERGSGASRSTPVVPTAETATSAVGMHAPRVCLWF